MCIPDHGLRGELPRERFSPPLHRSLCLPRTEGLEGVERTYSRAEMVEFGHHEDSLIVRAADQKASIGEATVSVL